MKIDLRQLTEHSGRLVSEETVGLGEVFDRNASVRCRVEVDYRQSGGAYFFHGDVTGALDTSCHRCLDDARVRLSGDFDVVVRRGAETETAEDDETAEGYIVLSLNEHEVSLGPFISESLIVNIPIQIVCKDDCLGLCPTCGNNLNRESCACKKPGDPRWDALRRLKAKPAE